MPQQQEVGHQIKFDKTLKGLFKKACWEIPEIMGASCLALAGFVMGCIAVYNYIQNDGDNREFKKVYIIMRPDDPRVSRLKNPVFTEYK